MKAFKHLTHSCCILFSTFPVFSQASRRCPSKHFNPSSPNSWIQLQFKTTLVNTSLASSCHSENEPTGKASDRLPWQPSHKSDQQGQPWYLSHCLKDGAYYCYCAYILRISRYSDFQSPMLTNTGIFLRSLKLSGESRS